MTELTKEEIYRRERKAFDKLCMQIAEQHRQKYGYVSTDAVIREATKIAQQVEREKLSTIYQKKDK